jgi:hypothetical protein
MIPLENLINLFQIHLQSNKLVIPNYKKTLETNYQLILNDCMNDGSLLLDNNNLCNHILNKYFDTVISSDKQNTTPEFKVLKISDDTSQDFLSEELNFFSKKGFIIQGELKTRNNVFIILQK